MADNTERWDDVSQITTQSDTKLENDLGLGKPVIIRSYEFAANPEAFKQHKPTKQELFNYHAKWILTQLWSDGLKPVEEVEPRVILNKRKTKYRIFVGAEPRQGQVLTEQTKTLAQLAHNT